MTTGDQFEDEALIHVNDSDELDYWRKQFNCTEQLLRDAVQRVGATVHDVKRFLGVR
jgi:uncharacterized protein DUF3606